MRWTSEYAGRMRVALAGVVTLLAVPAMLRADVVITDFNAAAPGGYNPRANWLAFGSGTTDSGVTADGAVGNGAYHSVDWASSTWGIGDVSTVVVDLSAYTAVTVVARVVDLGGWSGTPLLAFALDLPNSTEWSTPAVAVTSTYQTYTFWFSSMTRTNGSGPRDLTQGKPKLVLRKNGQAGQARFDFDQVMATGSASGGYALTPVLLNPPWDGDNVRAMWLYSDAEHLLLDNVAESQAILDFCAREGVNRIYYGGYAIWTDGTATLKDHLRTFLTVAHESGIRVEALLDGTNWHNHPDIVISSIDEILAIHNATPGTTIDDFDAIHFDIEFWRDSATWIPPETQKQQQARNYLDNVLVNARTHLDSLELTAIGVAADLSTHFDTAEMLPSPFLYNGVTQYFVQHVLDHANDVVLMSYYDTAGAIYSTTVPELDQAAAKGRRLQLGADLQPIPPENPVNTFVDNSPTPYSAMTVALQTFHQALSASRLAALDGFSIFNYEGYSGLTPNPLSRADLNGDGTVNLADYTLFASYWGGPDIPALSVKRDADYDGSGSVDLADFARFSLCFTGDNCGCPVPADCER